ncbi:hypothetical protein GR11A_00082 [Vibrio phage vB_VcorM_GR11A]|nr:hypothetical protein GR11A_00082 [Vibrio phage vB_VcorM_GR11A]
MKDSDIIRTQRLHADGQSIHGFCNDGEQLAVACSPEIASHLVNCWNLFADQPEKVQGADVIIRTHLCDFINRTDLTYGGTSHTYTVEEPIEVDRALLHPLFNVARTVSVRITVEDSVIAAVVTTNRLDIYRFEFPRGDV